MLHHVLINDRTAGAKKMLEYLRTLDFAEVHEEVPNKLTKAAIKEARNGKAKGYASASDLLADLKK